VRLSANTMAVSQVHAAAGQTGVVS
jgi:hypothetical protein